MKKKIIPIILCIMLAALGALAGCGGESYSKIKVQGKQDTGYVVQGNGGISVQYGNYVYFVNGYAGYEDTDGEQNTWPNVVKGGLYRAELCGNSVNRDYGKDFVPAANENAVVKGFEFASSVGKGQNDEDIDVVSVQPIAPKRIGTAGYSDGGIFIYDDYVYFASPNNEKNKSGTVQTTKTDFFRAKLDGSKVNKIYTTANDGNDTSPYAFYKYDGAVYLVAKDGSDLVSVKIANKIDKKVTIAKNITSVVLPYSQIYYSGMNENTLDHFVYVLRSVTDDDRQKSGNVIEIMRPDGKSGGVYHAQDNTDTIEAVRDGLLFYRTTSDAKDNKINYDSLHNFLMGNDEYTENGKKVEACSVYGDKAYRKYYSSMKEDDENLRVQIDGTVLSTSSISDYTSTYCFRPSGEQSNNVYMLGVKSGEVELRSTLNNTVTILNGTATILNVVDEYMYYTDSENGISRVRWDYPASENAPEKISDSDVTSSGFNADYCAGYIVYFGKVNDIADGYTFFKAVERTYGSDAIFVGKKIGDDSISAPKISAKNHVISWSAVNNAATYTLYRNDNGNAVVVEKDITETSYTLSDGESGEFYLVALSADGTKSEKSNTVTVK